MRSIIFAHTEGELKWQIVFVGTTQLISDMVAEELAN